jgi:hypothetical protein
MSRAMIVWRICSARRWRQWTVGNAMGLYSAALAATFARISCAPGRKASSCDRATAKIVGIDVGISGFLFNLSSWYLV